MSSLTPEMPGSWYAIHTRSRHEHVVEHQLRQKLIEAFLPTITRLSRWSDRTKQVVSPLFPGYCFARCTTADTLPILACSGVLSIVSFGGQPASIPDRELEPIRRLMRSKLKYDPCPFIPEGATVEVIDGPLRGITGSLMRKDATHASVVLSVDIIGRGVRVEVDADAIRQIDPIVR